MAPALAFASLFFGLAGYAALVARSLMADRAGWQVAFTLILAGDPLVR